MSLPRLIRSCHCTGASGVPGTLTNLPLRGFFTVNPFVNSTVRRLTDTLTWDFQSAGSV